MGIVAVFVGIILGDKSDPALIIVNKFVDGRTGRLAVRSLEVEKFYDRDQRVPWPLLRGVADGDIVTLRI